MAPQTPVPILSMLATANILEIERRVGAKEPGAFAATHLRDEAVGPQALPPATFTLSSNASRHFLTEKSSAEPSGRNNQKHADPDVCNDTSILMLCTPHPTFPLSGW